MSPVCVPLVGPKAIVIWAAIGEPAMTRTGRNNFAAASQKEAGDGSVASEAGGAKRLPAYLQAALAGTASSTSTSSRTLKRKASEAAVERLNAKLATPSPSSATTRSPDGTCSVLADSISQMFRRLSQSAVSTMTQECSCWGDVIRIASGCSGTDGAYDVFQLIFNSLSDGSLCKINLECAFVCEKVAFKQSGSWYLILRQPQSSVLKTRARNHIRMHQQSLGNPIDRALSKDRDWTKVLLEPVGPCAEHSVLRLQ